MKQVATTLAVAGMLALGGQGAWAGGKVAAADVRAAVDGVLGPGGGAAGLLGVVDLVVSLEGASPKATPAREKLRAARKLAESSTVLDDRIRAALGEAYAALRGGRHFAFPEGVKTVDDARREALARVDLCLAELKAGRPEAAARELLGFVLLVATPRHAEA